MRLVACLIAALLAASPAVAAPVDKYSITPEEHAACDGDAQTFCAYTYPDEDELLACMKASITRLSRECAAALTAGLKRRHIPL